MKSRTSSSGFTLLEVLVAMMIMVGGIVVLASAWSGNFGRIKMSRINNSMASLLERKMTELEIQYQEKPLDEVKDADAGDFGPLYPGYRWEMKSQPFEMPSMTAALTARDGGADQMLLTMMSTVQEFIKQSVKEVSVSVFFKGKHGGELKHTVTTYLIDYTKELPMPGAGAEGIGGASSGGAAGGSSSGSSKTGTTHQ